jgi:hypothetical protein
VLDHYVAFRPAEGTEAALVAALGGFGAAIVELASVREITWGENTNPSGRDRGYTVGCLVRITDENVLRGEYWHHPAHQKLLAELDRLSTDRFAVDYLHQDRSGTQGGADAIDVGRGGAPVAESGADGR